MSLFCKHEWKMLSETITESELEHAIRTLRQHRQILDSCRGVDLTRKCIQIVTCDKCGEIKQYCTEI